jgi:hypothetical protein
LGEEKEDKGYQGRLKNDDPDFSGGQLLLDGSRRSSVISVIAGR